MSSPPNVPYQAYRSKRHSRNPSNPYLTPNVSPPLQSRPPVSHTNGASLSEPIVPQQHDFAVDLEKQAVINGLVNRLGDIPKALSLTDSVPQSEYLKPISTNVVSVPVEPSSPSEKSPSPALSLSNPQTPPLAPVSVPHSPATPDKPLINGTPQSAPDPVASSSTPSSPGPSPKPTTTRRVSTFRHVPPVRPTTQRPLGSSPLRPAGTHSRTLSSNISVSTRHLDPQQPRSPVYPSSRVSSTASTPLLQPVQTERALPSIPVLDLPASSPNHRPELQLASSPSSQSVMAPPRSSSLVSPPVPPPKPITPTNSQSHSIPSTPASVLSPASSSSSIPTVRQNARSMAPYRPGFQPHGVYRPRTDEYIERRKAGRDTGRVERTRMERRLEKLINLHFPHPDQARDKPSENSRPSAQARRQSSFFDLTFNDLRTKSAGDLWKEVLTTQPAPGSKADIRSTEQTITPWEDDAAVSQCPLCTASFHPLTNRKHHCRLCGRIVCSLPVKYPQRPQTCSLLFVADPVTGRIEEVGEGVDYGVRRRTASTVGKGKGKEISPSSDEDKFLKGVRICRDCRPVILRRQYMHEVHQTPMFSKLYAAFVMLEKEIEEALPQFQELLMKLNNEERPVPEASAARKRLLEAFSQYDALAKRIRLLPCPGGQGSSQDRVQLAILTRANLFLQKNMFPLQAIPKPKKSTGSGKPSPSSTTPEPGGQLVDPNSEIAHALQPLLEQEALLESFVEEAKAHRKFEDAKTLKDNLREIRAEIDRMLANADTGATAKGKGRSG
ncbi:FYVE-domain-containing protein [Cristinia sonorae]|uniref:FYVE-domain-containing protein n=1 Tax=Cristinia sonorae TaxID=1940300 RepID=A0A8K0UX53_9AGAR|nr:FYVE-domain-containing protein [Cristinia sonorae]